MYLEIGKRNLNIRTRINTLGIKPKKIIQKIKALIN